MSWDRLQSQLLHSMHSLTFLSEQPSSKYSAMQYQYAKRLTSKFALTRFYSVRPLVQDPLTHIKHLSLSSLRQSLISLLTGTSSPLWVWDTTSQSFIVRGLNPKQRAIIMIDGKDDLVGERLATLLFRHSVTAPFEPSQ